MSGQGSEEAGQTWPWWQHTSVFTPTSSTLGVMSMLKLAEKYLKSEHPLNSKRGQDNGSGHTKANIINFSTITNRSSHWDGNVKPKTHGIGFRCSIRNILQGAKSHGTKVDPGTNPGAGRRQKKCWKARMRHAVTSRWTLSLCLQGTPTEDCSSAHWKRHQNVCESRCQDESAQKNIFAGIDFVVCSGKLLSGVNDCYDPTLNWTNLSPGQLSASMRLHQDTKSYF